jgi:DsbC/DsbD-like thiol-disulfide interchange protein
MTQDDVLRAELRPGWQRPDGRRVTALHLRLAPEWKTYWRAPGDAGIPPSFDWSGSENLAGVRLHWPAPEVFHTNGIQSIGYHDALVLPIEIVPKDAGRPVRLALTVDLGVCRDICMPASVTLGAELAGSGAPDAVIKSALAARPVEGREAGLGSIACTVEPIRDGMRVAAVLDLPAQGRDEAVVIEPGAPGLWVSEAAVRRDGGRLHAEADVVAADGAPFALDREAMVVTVIGTAGRAVEIRGCPAP